MRLNWVKYMRGSRNCSSTFIGVAASIWLSHLAVAQQIIIKPYIQPGLAATRAPTDTAFIRWFTDPTPAAYEVHYRVGQEADQSAAIGRSELKFTGRPDYYRYTSPLANLPLDSEVHYVVRSRGELIGEGTFRTRRSATNDIEFMVVGDLADTGEAHRATAYRLWSEQPDFAILLGDIVYDRGRFGEYLRNFWSGWNSFSKPSRESGAPALASVLSYVTVGNHDVGGTNLFTMPDGMAIFYFFTAPTNGPPVYRAIPPIRGTPSQWNEFRSNTGRVFPGLCFYSFDNGPAHFVVLDMAEYSGLIEPTIRHWLERDLAQSKAPWKFVFSHQPAFQSGKEHYEEQRLRMLQPVFEKYGVDIVFAGHVHNYQRSKPLRFIPARWRPLGFVDGAFTIDERFDGQTERRPQGVIHIISGAGGAKLHTDRATEKQKAVDGPLVNWAPFTAKYVANLHSVTRVRLKVTELHLEQLDSSGQVIDEIWIDKGRTR